MSALPNCTHIYAPAGQAGEYAPLAANPYRGCGHKCLAPETLIQMADGRARRVSDIKAGDQLIGVSREDATLRSWGWRITTTIVKNVWPTVQDAYRITLDDGKTAVCSGDHRWLTERGWKYVAGSSTGEDQRPHLTTNNLIRTLGAVALTQEHSEEFRRGYLSGMIRGDAHFGQQFRLALADIEALDRSEAFLNGFGFETARRPFINHSGVKPMEQVVIGRAGHERLRQLIVLGESAEWMRGWLSGIFDAEGSYSQVVRISNSDPAILEVTERAMDSLSLSHVRDVENDAGVAMIRLTGGRDAITRFFSTVNPAISRKFNLLGKALCTSSAVVGIESLGQSMEMFDVETTTENFVANGMISHNCAYCYVPAVLRMDRKEFDAGAVPREGFLGKLTKEAKKYQAAGITEQVMLSFTTDPYHPGDTSLTRETLLALKEHGLGFCTLTKGGSRALRDLDLFRADRDAFASTLTSLDPAFSAKWERGAASPEDRIGTLAAFHAAGIFTWVSLEPTLDVEASLAIVQATHSFVDLYKVGRANYLSMTRTTNWEDYTHRMIDLLASLGCRAYIKKDLQKYLPAGYPNPLRVPQHHGDQG